MRKLAALFALSAVVADGNLDRLEHNAYGIEVRGDSIREKRAS